MTAWWEMCWEMANILGDFLSKSAFLGEWAAVFTFLLPQRALFFYLFAVN